MVHSLQNNDKLSTITLLPLVILAYYLTGKLGLLLAIPPGFASAVWPPSGIAVAAHLLYGHRALPGIFLGSLLVNLDQSLEVWGLQAVLSASLVAAPIALGSSLQALLGSWLIRRFVGFPSTFIDTRQILFFSLLAGPLACTVAASFGVSTLYVNQLIHISDFVLSWLTWWVGDVIGVLVFAPLVLILGSPSPDNPLSRRIQVAAPLILVFTLAVMLFSWTRDAETRRISNEFNQRALIEVQGIERQLTGILAGLGAIKGLFAASNHVSVNEFERFFIHLEEFNPGLEVASWIQRVPQDKRLHFEQLIRDQGAPFPFIRQLQDNELIRSPDRDEYLSIQYNSSGKGYSNPIIGFDPSAESRRSKAIERARRTGLASATAPLQLAQSQRAYNSIVVFVPVFAQELPKHTYYQSGLSGLIAGVFNVETLIRQVLTASSDKELSLQVTDITDPKQTMDLHRTEATSLTDYRWQKILSFAGRQWQVVMTPTEAYVRQRQGWSAWWTLIGAMLFVWLTGALLLVITGREMLVRQQVVEKTSQLRSALSHAEAANNAKTQFLASMSHELRTPLNSIIGFTTRLLRKANTEEQCQNDKLTESLEIIKRNGQHLLDLINDILDVTKIESGEMALSLETINVRTFIADLAMKVKPMLSDKDIHFHTHLENPELTLQADSRRLQQIFLNLLSNAIKFTEQGSISLSASAWERKGRSGVLFAVSDTGIGITAEDQSRLFRRFSQIDSRVNQSVEGTGLGLVLVKEFAEMHGGKVTLQSQEGQGSCFEVWLPKQQ